jgi:thiamine-phosphate pyrophosphorylase
MERFAITDRRLGLASHEQHETARSKRLIERSAALAARGVEYILIREKDLSARSLAALGRGVIEAVRTPGFSTKILIAVRADVAMAIGADGVHLSSAPGELTPQQVRTLMPEAFISISCHTLSEVIRARDYGASAILFGPIFGKSVNGIEVVPGIGLSSLAEACKAAGSTPVFALGGINPANAKACIDSGAKGIAAIRMFFC